MTVSIVHHPTRASLQTGSAWQALDLSLRQLREWLGTVVDSHYRGEMMAEGLNIPQGQTPGKHTRHIVDHMSALCMAIERTHCDFAIVTLSAELPEVDYDQRTRDPILEQHPEQALLKLESLCKKLKGWCGCPGQMVRVRHDSGTDVHFHDSSMERELIYVAEHAIHHMALINLLMVVQGEQLPTGFGMNPSTLRYQAQLADGSFDVRAN